MKTSEPLPKLEKGKKYLKPHISFDGKYWYLCVGYEVPEIKCDFHYDTRWLGFHYLGRRLMQVVVSDVCKFPVP